MKNNVTQKSNDDFHTGLWALLDAVPDPRDPSGRRHLLGNILRLMLTGFLCGCNCTAEVLRWAQKLSKQYKTTLGFPNKLISAGALSNLFAKIDMASLEKILNEQKFNTMKDPSTLLHIAIDGKTIKGSAYNLNPAVHLLSAFAVKLKATIKQEKEQSKDNEITTAIKLLQGLELEGTVITGDAIFAQKKFVRP